MSPVKSDRRAYDAARRAAGLDRRKKPDLRSCWRCDIEFNAHYCYHANTPCTDCRQFLKNIDGETTIWRGPPAIRAERTFT